MASRGSRGVEVGYGQGHPLRDPGRGSRASEGFYGSIFGWGIEDVPEVDYTIVRTVTVDDQQMPTEPGAINGGMMQRTPQTPVSPVLTIGVASVEDALNRIEEPAAPWCNRGPRSRAWARSATSPTPRATPSVSGRRADTGSPAVVNGPAEPHRHDEDRGLPSDARRARRVGAVPSRRVGPARSEGNIKLGQAVADVGSRVEFEDLLAWTGGRLRSARARFLAFCGTVGLGKLAAEGELDVLPRLRALASDPVGGSARPSRWLSSGSASWTCGCSSRRCAPGRAGTTSSGGRRSPRASRRSSATSATFEVLAILDIVTEALSRSPDRRSEGFERSARAGVLLERRGSGGDAGRPAMERWMGSEDPDVRWVMTQNLTKRRLQAAGADWVARWRGSMTAAGSARTDAHARTRTSTPTRRFLPHT